MEDDGDDIRYYLNHNKDYEETYKEMLKYDEIVYDYKIPLFEKFAEDTTDLDRGIIYGHLRDEYQRPIVYWDVMKYIKSDMSIDDLLDVMFMTAFYTQTHALIPGKIETLVVVVDAKNIPVYELPYSTAV